MLPSSTDRVDKSLEGGYRLSTVCGVMMVHGLRWGEYPSGKCNPGFYVQRDGFHYGDNYPFPILNIIADECCT